MSDAPRPIQPARVAELIAALDSGQALRDALRYVRFNRGELRELLACYALYVHGDHVTFEEAMEPAHPAAAEGGEP